MHYAENLQRIVRSRTARLALGFALIALSVWAFLPYVNYRISTSAFVNAELVHMAAPIAGRLTRKLPRKGDFIEQPKTVTLIEALSRDQRHLLNQFGHLKMFRMRKGIYGPQNPFVNVGPSSSGSSKNRLAELGAPA